VDYNGTTVSSLDLASRGGGGDGGACSGEEMGQRGRRANSCDARCDCFNRQKG
jgi:hypothetical protein